MFDASSPFSTSEVFPPASGNLEHSERPLTFTIQHEFGVWCAQFSQCDASTLIRTFSTVTGRKHISKLPIDCIPGFPPPPQQWIENPTGQTEITDLLCAPECAFRETQGRVAFVELDKNHTSVYTTNLTDLYEIWRAWLCQHYPGSDLNIDPHRTKWSTHASLLWPHPPGQWSQIRQTDDHSVIAFDIVDYGWEPSGEIFSRTRLRIVKTFDKSWRTGWMW